MVTFLAVLIPFTPCPKHSFDVSLRWGTLKKKFWFFQLFIFASIARRTWSSRRLDKKGIWWNTTSPDCYTIMYYNMLWFLFYESGVKNKTNTYPSPTSSAELPFSQIFSESSRFFSPKIKWNSDNLTQNSKFFGFELGRDFYIKVLFW